jgi:hypothetical protein
MIGQLFFYLLDFFAPKSIFESSFHTLLSMFLFSRIHTRTASTRMHSLRFLASNGKTAFSLLLFL